MSACRTCWLVSSTCLQVGFSLPRRPFPEPWTGSFTTLRGSTSSARLSIELDGELDEEAWARAWFET